jgi:hypothetical protein
MPKLVGAQGTPLRPDTDLVKELQEPRPGSSNARGLRRHLAGYELGLTTVAMVLTCALLALPRASVPTVLPLPRVNRLEARRSAEAERALVTRVEAEGLPFDVRAVGEALRHFGRSSAEEADTSHDREDIRKRVAIVIRARHGSLLLCLRAVQTQYFLGAVRRFERDGRTNAELEELGGDFVSHSRRAGWLSATGQLLPDEATRRVLFQLRFADLIGKTENFPFSPTLNEWRLYYRFLLQSPTEDGSNSDAPSADRARLAHVRALAKRDPTYPIDLAQGYLLYRLGDADAAASAYRRHLGLHEGGPYALLARNDLIYTLEGLSSE